jgi:hypothetical protein
MATPRSQLVDESVTPWYHCISRCVRRARLCGEDRAHRKDWIVGRLRQLVGIFAVDCGGFAVMDNHLHLLVRLDSPRVRGWSDEEVARRWLTLHPLRGAAGEALPVTPARVRRFAADAAWVARMRARLANLGWFMKSLKEPLARMANREDGCTGAFWEGRFRSVPVLDEEALLAVAVYIDLNPFAAGAAATPESAEHTSLRERLDQALTEGATRSPRAEQPTLDPGLRPIRKPCSWLSPTDDQSEEGYRYGLAPGYTLAHHLRLVDAAARLGREGKARLHSDAAPIFERLGLDVSRWLKAFDAIHRRRPTSRLGRPRPFFQRRPPTHRRPTSPTPLAFTTRP